MGQSKVQEGRDFSTAILQPRFFSRDPSRPITIH